MKARIKWIEGKAFVGESDSGHAVLMDGPPESAGRTLCIRSIEMILLGLGSFPGFDVIHILEKARQPPRRGGRAIAGMPLPYHDLHGQVTMQVLVPDATHDPHATLAENLEILEADCRVRAALEATEHLPHGSGGPEPNGTVLRR